MFDARDHIWGESVARRRGGGLTAARVAWRVFRYRMIQFAKYVAVESLNSTASIEEIVDAWLSPPPPPPQIPQGDDVGERNLGRGEGKRGE